MTALDDPIWHALTTEHRDLAISHGEAHRYPSDIAAFVAAHSFDDLRRIVTPGERLASFTAGEVALPPGWTLMHERWIEQMVFEGEPAHAPDGLLTLGAADVEEMLALTKLTEPGPFFARTHVMGRYAGIREDGRLAAMAGERLKLTGATEISAVCTHPDFQGRGYGRLLMDAMIATIQGDDAQPFLHVKNENGAKRLYEKLGFRVRRELRLTVFTARAA